MPARSRSSIESRCLMRGPPGGSVMVTSSAPSSSATRTFTRSERCGREVLADVVGADRQLAVAAVGEHGELDAAGPPVVEQRLDRGADGAAGVEHVVDEDDRVVLEPERQVAGADLGRLARGEVVAVEGDVDVARGQLGLEQVGDQPVQPRGEVGAAAVDADEGDRARRGSSRRSRARSARACAARRPRRGRPSPGSSSRSFLASRGRVKGTADEPSSARGGEPAAPWPGGGLPRTCYVSSRAPRARCAPASGAS